MLEIKKMLRKRKLWIAMVCILLCGVLSAVYLNEKAATEHRALYADALEAENKVKHQLFMLMTDDNAAYFKTLTQKSERLKSAIQNKDWRAVNKNYAEVNLLHARRVSALYATRNFNLYYREYVTKEDTLEALRKERKLPEFSDREISEDWANSYMDNDETQMFPYYQFTARFYDQLEKQGIATLTYSTTDSATLIVQFMRSLFPILPVILITLLCFDSIHEDRDSGVIKTLLSQPRKRICYLHQKIRTNLAALCAIFFIPLLLLSLCFGIFDHYERMQAPVLSNVQGLTSLEQMENTLAETEENNAMTYTLGITRYFSIPYQTQSPNSKFDFLPMWQFTGWCVLMALLVILFCMLLNMLFNAICRNKMTSLVLTLCHSAAWHENCTAGQYRDMVCMASVHLFQSRGHSQRLYVLYLSEWYSDVGNILRTPVCCNTLDLPEKGCSIKKSAHLRQHQPASTYAKQHITAYVEKLWHNGIRCSDFFFLRPRIYHGRLRGICSHGGFPTSSSPSSTITDSGNSPRYQAACAR